jgi:hypothetical protein
MAYIAYFLFLFSKMPSQPWLCCQHGCGIEKGLYLCSSTSSSQHFLFPFSSSFKFIFLLLLRLGFYRYRGPAFFFSQQFFFLLLLYVPQAFRQIGWDAPVSFSLSGFFSASSSSLQFNNRQSSKLCLLSKIIQKGKKKKRSHTSFHQHLFTFNLLMVRWGVKSSNN